METTDPIAGLRFRPLDMADISAGERLSREAGWNQNAADWTFILNHGLGWGYEDQGGELGATAMVLPYGDKVAWICLVLVTPSLRNRGLATTLLRHCIQQAEERNWVPGLDATEAGRQVYLPLGFSDILPLTRFMAENVDGLEQPVDDLCRPMVEADLPIVTGLDEATTGAKRADLLESLHTRAPHLCWVAECDDAIDGFCLGRDGSHADQIGPIFSDGDEMAIALARQALLARPDHSRRIYIDALTDRKVFCEWLHGRGFDKQRGFSRMLKGQTTALGDCKPLFAIAGPELA